MTLVQLIAVRNSLRESLEVTRWVEANADSDRAGKEMMALVQRLYPKLTRSIRTKREPIMVATGETNQELDKTVREESKKLTQKIHYALYEGHCLDPKRLSYFMPERTVEEGDLTLAEVKALLAR